MTVVNTNIAETINITTNGEYNVARYTTANVNTPAAPAHYFEFTVDGNGKAVNGSHITDFTGITDISDYLFAYQYCGNTSISGAVDMSDLTTISGNQACSSMFTSCTGITSVDLSSLTTISGKQACSEMFYGCTSLTSVDLSSLTAVNSSNGCSFMFSGCTSLTSVDLSSFTTSGLNAVYGCNGMFYGCTGITSIDLSLFTRANSTGFCANMFSGCTSLTSVDLSGLTMIYNNGCNSMFANCTSLTSVDLSSLTSLKDGFGCSNMFSGCTSLTTLSFPALTSNSFGSRTNEFNNMLQGVTSCTVHFPSNLQSVIGSWADVTAGFGGTNTTVLFDLPATE